jgi:2-hydroxy-3-oxopropionate reductase
MNDQGTPQAFTLLEGPENTGGLLPRVGFIGLGAMGLPMARRVAQAGFDVTAYARSDGPVRELVRLGCEAASSPKDLAGRSEVIVTMLPSSRDLDDVLRQKHGILEGLTSGSIVVDMGTHEPASARAFEKLLGRRGVAFLDAPVSGGDVGAQAGTLSIMVGGPEAIFRQALPVLNAMGTTVTRIGDTGSGQIAKVCNQLVVGSTIQAVAEALVLAYRAGVDPSKVREALQGGYAASRVLDVHGERMLQRRFVPGARARLHLKDAQIVLSTARALGVSIPGFRPVARALRQLVREGRGDQDHSALITLVEGATGVILPGADDSSDLD